MFLFKLKYNTIYNINKKRHNTKIQEEKKGYKKTYKSYTGYYNTNLTF